MSTALQIHETLVATRSEYSWITSPPLVTPNLFHRQRRRGTEKRTANKNRNLKRKGGSRADRSQRVRVSAPHTRAQLQLQSREPPSSFPHHLLFESMVPPMSMQICMRNAAMLVSVMSTA